MNDAAALEQALRAAAEAANTTVVQAIFHRFAPQGVSGVVVIEESHLSIHTWPEVGYAAVDFYTCGEGEPEAADATLRGALKPDRTELMVVERGLVGPRSLHVREHLHAEAVSQ